MTSSRLAIAFFVQLEITFITLSLYVSTRIREKVRYKSDIIRVFHVVVIYIRAPVDRLVSGMVLAETTNPVSRWVSNLDSNKACSTDYTEEGSRGQLCGCISVPVSTLHVCMCVFCVSAFYIVCIVVYWHRP